MVWGSKVRFNAKVEQVLFRRRPSYDRFPSDGVECPLGMARKCWHRGYVPLRSASPELPRRFRSVPSLQSQQRRRLLGRVPEETPHSTDEEENEREEKATKRKRLRKKGEGEEQVLKTEKGKRSHSEQKRKRQEEEEEKEDQQQEGNEGEGEKKVKRRKKEEEEKVEEKNFDGKENQRENAEKGGEQQLKKRKKKKTEEKETGRQQVEEQGGEEKRKRKKKKKKKIPKRPLEENGEQETNTKRKREGKDNRRLINTEEKDQRSQVKEDERGEAELAKIVWEMQQSGCSCVGRCHPRTCECLQADIPCCHAWLPGGRSGCNCSSETCCNTDERRAEGRHDRRREHYRDTVSRVYINEYFPNDSSDEDEDRPPRWPTDDEDDDETIDEVK